MAVTGIVIIALGLLHIKYININHRANFYEKGDLFRNHNNVRLIQVLCFLFFVGGPLMLNVLPLCLRIVISVVLIIFLVMDVRKGASL